MEKTKYMIGIKEGENNDWAPTVDGYLQMEYDKAMLRQQIDACVKTLPNEVDGFDGVDYINVIFNDTSMLVKAQAVIDAIKTISLVKEVNLKSIDWVDKTKGFFRMSFDIDSYLGDINYDLSINEQDKTLTSSIS